MNFDKWYSDLISDTRWYELLRHYKDDTIKKASEKVYAQLVADKVEDVKPMTENRKHVYNIVCKNPGDKVLVPWHVQEAKKLEQQQKESTVDISEEEIKVKLQQWQDSLKNVQMVSAVPRLSAKQIIEEGNWRAVSTMTPKSEVEKALIVEEHIQKVNAARRKVFTSAYPDASEEEIEAYISKFKTI